MPCIFPIQINGRFQGEIQEGLPLVPNILKKLSVTSILQPLQELRIQKTFRMQQMRKDIIDIRFLTFHTCFVHRISNRVVYTNTDSTKKEVNQNEIIFKNFPCAENKEVTTKPEIPREDFLSRWQCVF